MSSSISQKAAALVAFIGFAGLGGACSDATGTVAGGEARFDASPPAPPAAPVGDGGGSGGTGTTFTDLYNDLLGPKGAGSCAGNGACHGDPNQPGTAASNFYCGTDKDTCYAQITSQQTSGPLLPTGKAFKDGYLYSIIRKADGTGRMPKTPFTYTFQQADLDRITTWVSNGTKND